MAAPTISAESMSKWSEAHSHPHEFLQEKQAVQYSGSDKELHIVMVSYPVQGHTNPMLHFANALINWHHCIRVSFITTKHHADRLRRRTCPHHQSFAANYAGSTSPSSPLTQAHDIMETIVMHAPADEDKLQFLCIPDGLPADFDYDTNLGPRLIQFHQETYKMREPLEQLLERLNQKSPPISCVIFGSFLPWVHTIASDLGIPSVLFWTQSASVLSMYYNMPLLAANGFFPYKREAALSDSKTDEMVSYVPGVPPLHRSSFPTLLRVDDPDSDPFLHEFREQMALLASCQGLIVNSFEELEKDAYQALQEKIPCPVSLVGPLISSALLAEAADAVQDARSLPTQEKDECIEWLDRKSKQSVLYVSFGSLFNPPVADLKSIANGIKESKKPFIWVIRCRSSEAEVAGMLPKEQGMIISWAKQVRVLAHPAIGAFLTHCGWNSTLESVSMGVPMIACPLISDQTTNCHFVCEQWKVGVALKRQADGCIRSQDVERMVRTILEEGEEMRKRAIKLKEAARRAVQAHGSSRMQMDQFIQAIRSVTP